MKRIAIADVCLINPRLSRDIASQKDRIVDFVPMTNLGENGRLTLNETRRLGEVLKGYTYFENGDVLVAKITPCMENGKAAYVYSLTHGIAFGSTEFHVLRPNNNIDPRYLFHMVWTPYFRNEASRNMTGTAGQQRVPSTFFERFEIPLPPLPEQKRIADILDKADSIRRKRKEARDTASEISLSAFQATFKKYLTQNACKSLLGDIAEVVSGITKGRTLGGVKVQEVPYLRVANVQAGYLDLSDIKTIQAKVSEVRELALRHGDVVMTEGGDYDKLGRGALWEHDIADCIHQNHVFRVRTNRRHVLPSFFVYYLQTHLAKDYFLRCAKKTTNLASINMTQLRSLPVPQTPLKLQERFEVELKAIRDILFRQHTALKEANCLFNSLIQRAFLGQL